MPNENSAPQDPGAVLEELAQVAQQIQGRMQDALDGGWQQPVVDGPVLNSMAGGCCRPWRCSTSPCWRTRGA